MTKHTTEYIRSSKVESWAAEREIDINVGDIEKEFLMCKYVFAIG